MPFFKRPGKILGWQQQLHSSQAIITNSTCRLQDQSTIRELPNPIDREEAIESPKFGLDPSDDELRAVGYMYGNRSFRLTGLKVGVLCYPRAYNAY
jgi:hypothetical protein